MTLLSMPQPRTPLPGDEGGQSPARRPLLLVSYDFPPVQGPGIWRALGMARHLPEFGWDVQVFAADRSHWHARQDSELLSRVPAAVSVTRVRAVPFGRGPLAALPEPLARRIRGLVPDPLLLPVLRLLAAVRRAAPPGPRVLVTTGPPHVVHLIGLALARSPDWYWVADYRDPWMDDEAQRWRGPYQSWLGRNAEQAVLERADLVTTVSPTWERQLSTRRQAPTALIRNATNIESGTVPDAERPWPAHERVLLFPGTPQPGNSSMTIWDGIRDYAQRCGGGSPLRLVFTGLYEDVHAIIREYGIGHLVEDIGPQPYRRALALMRGADGILVPVSTPPTSPGTIPAKIYDALALGCSIFLLADPEGDAAALLAGGGHMVVPSGDPGEFAEGLRRFASGEPTKDPTVPADLIGWDRRASAEALDRLLRQHGPFADLRTVPIRGEAGSPLAGSAPGTGPAARRA